MTSDNTGPTEIEMMPQTGPAEENFDLVSDSTVRVSSATKDMGKRVYDKVHYCLFCHKAYSKMARHLVQVHGAETAVASLPRDGVAKRLKLELLLRKGDFHHNHEVLCQKRGNLVVLRRPNEVQADVTTYEDFGPCPECLGFVHKNLLWHHVRSCPHKPANGNYRRPIQKESRSLLADCKFRNGCPDTGFVTDILSALKNDDVSGIISQDTDI